MVMRPILRFVLGRRDMREEDTGGTHGVIKRRRRHRLGQPWTKQSRKLKGFDGLIGTCSRVRG